MDIVNKTTKWMDYNRGTFLAFIVIGIMAGGIAFMGCQ